MLTSTSVFQVQQTGNLAYKYSGIFSKRYSPLLWLLWNWRFSVFITRFVDSSNLKNWSWKGRHRSTSRHVDELFEMKRISLISHEYGLKTRTNNRKIRDTYQREYLKCFCVNNWQVNPALGCFGASPSLALEISTYSLTAHSLCLKLKTQSGKELLFVANKIHFSVQSVLDPRKKF